MFVIASKALHVSTTWGATLHLEPGVVTEVGAILGQEAVSQGAYMVDKDGNSISLADAILPKDEPTVTPEEPAPGLSIPEPVTSKTPPKATAKRPTPITPEPIGKS